MSRTQASTTLVPFSSSTVSIALALFYLGMFQHREKDVEALDAL
jgi:hypothetical protein